MRLYDLGFLPWKHTQLVYHALAQFSEESIVICSPKEEYACVGFHQDVTQELDIDYCEEHKIGIFRREIGGGSVFLDKDQLFYQIIIKREKAPLDQKKLFKRLLEPIIRTYQALGIQAKYVPVSDLVVNGRKISGNGGGDIGNCKVMTGSILFNFNYETMCRILRFQSDRFRQDVCLAMKNNLTTVKNELGYIPDYNEFKHLLISNFEDMFGTFEKSLLDSKAINIMKELDDKFSSYDWLFKKRKQAHFRTIKIMEGINLSYIEHKDVKMCIEIIKEEIQNVKIYSHEGQEYHSDLNKLMVGSKFDESFVLKSLNLIFGE